MPRPATTCASGKTATTATPPRSSACSTTCVATRKEPFVPFSHRLLLAPQNKSSEFCAPLTSFDWNELDVRKLGTSSIDTTCTIWDITVCLWPRRRLFCVPHMPRDLVSSFVRHPPSPDRRRKKSAQPKSARARSRRSSLHTTRRCLTLPLARKTRTTLPRSAPTAACACLTCAALNTPPSCLRTAPPRSSALRGTAKTRTTLPCVRLGWVRARRRRSYHRRAQTMKMDESGEVVVIDIRVPCATAALLSNHEATVNAIAWAPHSSCHLCTAGSLLDGEGGSSSRCSSTRASLAQGTTTRR